MSDTSNAPSTVTISERDRILEYLDAYDITEEQKGHLLDGFTAQINGERAKAAAQLQEADTQLVTLRDSLEQLIDVCREAIDSAQPFTPKADRIEYRENTVRPFIATLFDTAEANKQALARIREEAVKPWREGVEDAVRVLDAEASHGNTEYAAGTALERLQDLLASQSKSDTE